MHRFLTTHGFTFLFTRYRFVVESNGLKDMEPLKSTGDGNCLFNSISILLIGSEDLAPLLRVLSFFYATLNQGRLEKWVRWNGMDPQVLLIILLFK